MRIDVMTTAMMMINSDTMKKMLIDRITYYRLPYGDEYIDIDGDLILNDEEFRRAEELILEMMIKDSKALIAAKKRGII